ncbi:hypothetical protein D9758_009081 [Tetrapyrgos nigripes]|uniref:Uncharacterized protein n=1 Tax=Tetrapyrgos nigripes TaxID=182062 RepID=A0A8H5GA36_9AGAR|nr:hypothetical protein D9758_009081 [Tetrapyrgos nigripes]
MTQNQKICISWEGGSIAGKSKRFRKVRKGTFISDYLRASGTWIGKYPSTYHSLIVDDNDEDARRLRNAVGRSLVAGGGLAVVPSIGVAAVNAIGFTSSGVAAGSVAAAIQSVFYGGATGGLFSAFQSFGATAVIASPVILGLGAAAAVAGGALLAVNRIKKAKETEQKREDEDGGED